MARSTRRNRVAFRPGAESLEGKMLLSGAGRGSVLVAGTNRHAAGSANKWVGYTAKFDRTHATREDGVVNLVVTRAASDAGQSRTFKLYLSATYNQVVTGPANPKSVALTFDRRALGRYSSGTSPDENGRHTVSWDMRTTGRDLSALPIVPVTGTYRFAPGQTSLTIPVRLNPDFVLPETGSISLQATVNRPGGGVYRWDSDLTGGGLKIVSGPNQVPAEIVASSMSERAITLTFDRDVDRVVAESLDNYVVSALLGYDTIALPIRKVLPLQSAAYDPTTRTLTLTPSAPFSRDQTSYQLLSPATFTSYGLYGGTFSYQPMLYPDGLLVGIVALSLSDGANPTEGPGGSSPAPVLAVAPVAPVSIPVRGRR